MKYAINETFYTFQGEGAHSGRPAYFIRLHGCPIRCHFCDSAGTWHEDYVPSDVSRLEPQEIVAAIPAQAPIVILTGGEPAMWDLEPLCQEIMAKSHRVHLETSGAFPLRGTFHWVTVSPKRAKLPVAEALDEANEFKFIIEHPEDIEYFTGLCSRYMHRVQAFLHPEWSHRDDPHVLAAITLAVKEQKYLYRAGWQIHKLYRADSQDPHSRGLVPLGGDLNKGY